MVNPPSTCLPAGNVFSPTHWSVVMAAGNKASSPEADAALEALCRAYWRPLYGYVCRKGYAPHDSEDLIQEFFARLVSKESLRAVDPRKGRFRSFLLAAMEHFLANQRRHHRAQKRGGGVSFVSLDDPAPDGGGSLQITGPGLTQERIFERQWAAALLDLVLTRLQAEFVENGKGRLFEEAKAFLTGAKQTTYEDAARRIGMSPAALKMAVVRMRQRYGELLRAEIVRTVSSPEEVEPELRALFAALSPVA
ncbi:MAG TPA: ECF-type sigma factor [Candidatus Saccharimonadales bacterium]|jgi:RNA polymerase sigma-70 factor (ECF subfamily)|nr:ECF-type sigma factor [Candidatus Saccharimonadales bacterium]